MMQHIKCCSSKCAICSARYWKRWRKL